MSAPPTRSGTADRLGPAGITIRVARTDDVPDLAAIEQEVFSDPWPESAFADFLERPHVRMTVATGEDDRAIGYCVLLVVADEGEIANIAVSAHSRRRGIAAALLDDALGSARERGVEAIYLEVRTSNAAARALYLSRHFVVVGRRRGYYRHPVEDALVLRWTRNRAFAGD